MAFVWGTVRRWALAETCPLCRNYFVYVLLLVLYWHWHKIGITEGKKYDL